MSQALRSAADAADWADRDRERERKAGRQRGRQAALALPCIPAQPALNPSPEAGNGQAGPVSGLIAALWLRLPKTHGVSVTAATCVDAIYRCGGSNRIVKKADALFSRFTRRRAETRLEHPA